MSYNNAFTYLYFNVFAGPDIDRALHAYNIVKNKYFNFTNKLISNALSLKICIYLCKQSAASWKLCKD
jgi:hypothetical protein